MSQTLKTHHPNNQEKGKEAEKPGTDENLSRPSAEPKLLDQLLRNRLLSLRRVPQRF